MVFVQFNRVMFDTAECVRKLGFLCTGIGIFLKFAHLSSNVLSDLVCGRNQTSSWGTLRLACFLCLKRNASTLFSQQGTISVTDN